MEAEKELKIETNKWLEKIKNERKKIKILSEMKMSSAVLRNIDAYIEDTIHFTEKGLFVQAFEAVIYAYGLLDAIKTLRIVQTNSQQ